MAGQLIEVKASDGSGSFSAYLATPKSGKAPGIVLAQEIFGINAYIRDMADQYAQQGYLVIAPDLFWRQQPGVDLGYSEADWQQAFKYFGGFDQDKGVEDIAAAAAALRTRPEFAGKVGCVGFCLGGKMAYSTACRTDVAVSVGYYGVGIEAALDEAANIGGKLVLHIAERDQYCPPAAREKIIGALGQRPNVSIFVYPGVDHAFARPASPHFDQSAADLAQQRSLAALSAALRA